VLTVRSADDYYVNNEVWQPQPGEYFFQVNDPGTYYIDATAGDSNDYTPGLSGGGYYEVHYPQGASSDLTFTGDEIDNSYPVTSFSDDIVVDDPRGAALFLTLTDWPGAVWIGVQDSTATYDWENLAPAGASHWTFVLPTADTYHVVGYDNSGNPVPLVTGAGTYVVESYRDGAGTLPATSSTSIDLPYVTGDSGQGVDHVELWSRYRESEEDEWGPWTDAQDATSSPISYTFESGAGEYQFYTVAVDASNDREDAPDVADATVEYQP
jgi:hypothetical protein